MTILILLAYPVIYTCSFQGPAVASPFAERRRVCTSSESFQVDLRKKGGESEAASDGHSRLFTYAAVDELGWRGAEGVRGRCLWLCLFSLDHIA